VACHHLHGDGTFQAHVLGLKDESHPALVQLRQDPVSAPKDLAQESSGWEAPFVHLRPI
jgi:hypothetical protein